MLHDMHNPATYRNAIDPQQTTSAAQIVGNIIDTQGFAALEFAILLGSITAATVNGTVLVEHGEEANLSDAAAVPDSELLGLESEAAFDQTDDDTTKAIGYKGKKRYVRLSVTPASNNAALDIAAIAVLSHPKRSPAS